MAYFDFCCAIRDAFRRHKPIFAAFAVWERFAMQGPLPLFDVPKDNTGVSRGMFAVASSTSNRPKLDLADLPSPPQNGTLRPR